VAVTLTEGSGDDDSGEGSGEAEAVAEAFGLFFADGFSLAFSFGPFDFDFASEPWFGFPQRLRAASLTLDGSALATALT